MQYSTFAAIDIGSYDVILEIFEISKKQGIRSVDKICHRMELGKDTYTLGKIRPEMEEELCRVLADFVRIMEGYRVDEIARMLNLPQGTGYVTDLGMTGPRDSVLGIRPELSIRRFRGDLPSRYEPAPGPCKLEACLFTIDDATGLCKAVRRVDIHG